MSGTAGLTDDPDDVAAVRLLRTTDEIRRRAGHLLARARAGDSPWFQIDEGAVTGAVSLVAETTRQRYPGLDIPFHSRWRHFEAGGVDRIADLDSRLGTVDQAERARAQIDLAVVSVLLDAGAGPDWYFDEPSSGRRFTRSEGLAIASVHAFADGLFSSDPDTPLQVDASGLRSIDAAGLRAAFGVGPRTPLVGLDGRLQMLHRLAEVLDARPDVFGSARPGGLFDHLTAGTSVIDAHDILSVLLDAFAPIWPSDNTIGALALGDCWHHDAVRGPGATERWMPFHKLSQWLTYSLLEPFSWAGVQVAHLDQLTALPEYRNGGLLLDTAVIVPRRDDATTRTWRVGDEFVVEWRALTVALLDEMAPQVAAHLGLDPDAMPLACVLEGGTWAAGRATAHRLRHGLPPLSITSDGTVF